MVMRPPAVDLRGSTSTPKPCLNSVFGFCLPDAEMCGRAVFTFWGFLVKSCQFVERCPPPHKKGFGEVQIFGFFFGRPCLCAPCLSTGGGAG